MSNSNGRLDTTLEIVTPENIAFEYRVAGPFRRLPAYAIDMVIRVVFLSVVGVILPLFFGLAGLPGMGLGLLLLTWFLVDWFYGGAFESLWNGQTPGKRLLGIRVLSRDGQPIGAFQAVLRNVLRAVDSQPFGLCLVGLVAAGMSRHFQRLGDLASGTVVIVEEQRWFRGVVSIPEPEAARLAGLIPLSFRASPTLARALAAYMSHRVRIPWARRMEIATYLGVPFRERFRLPMNTNLDMLLCALYYRTFVAERIDSRPLHAASPFREPDSQQPAGSPFAPSHTSQSLGVP